MSRTADYAIRALLVLARIGSRRPMAAVAIARLTGSPANYTSKTLYALARVGLLRSVRGPAGGFVLAVPPHEISIARVIDVFSDIPRAPRCLLGTGPCNSVDPCAAHTRWTRVAAASREPLEVTSIADLLAGDQPAAAAS